MSDPQRLLVCNNAGDVPADVLNAVGHCFAVRNGIGAYSGLDGQPVQITRGSVIVWQGRSLWVHDPLNLEMPVEAMVVFVLGQSLSQEELRAYSDVGCRYVVVFGADSKEPATRVHGNVEVIGLGAGQWRTLTANDLAPVGVRL